MSVLARALIEAEIKGRITEKPIEDEPHTLRVPSPVLEFYEGVVTAVASVAIGESTLDPSDYRVTHFGVQRLDGDFPARSVITVSYTVGWAAAGEPAAILEAERLIDEWLETDPGSGVTKYREGDLSVERLAASVDFPMQAGILLREYRRP